MPRGYGPSETLLTTLLVWMSMTLRLYEHQLLTSRYFWSGRDGEVLGDLADLDDLVDLEVGERDPVDVAVGGAARRAGVVAFDEALAVHGVLRDVGEAPVRRERALDGRAPDRLAVALDVELGRGDLVLDGLDELGGLGVVHGDRVLVHHVLGEDVAGAGADHGLGRDLRAHDGLALLELERGGRRAGPGGGARRWGEHGLLVAAFFSPEPEDAGGPGGGRGRSCRRSRRRSRRSRSRRRRPRGRRRARR